MGEEHVRIGFHATPEYIQKGIDRISQACKKFVRRRGH